MVPVWTFRYVVPLTPFIIGYLVAGVRLRGPHAWRVARVVLLCVIGLYISGRVLDWIWTGVGSGVVVNQEGSQSEVEAYATRGPEEFTAWRSQTAAARKRLESDSATTRTQAKRDKIREANRIIDARERESCKGR